MNQADHSVENIALANEKTQEFCMRGHSAGLS